MQTLWRVRWVMAAWGHEGGVPGVLAKRRRHLFGRTRPAAEFACCSGACALQDEEFEEGMDVDVDKAGLQV